MTSRISCVANSGTIRPENGKLAIYSERLVNLSITLIAYCGEFWEI